MPSRPKSSQQKNSPLTNSSSSASDTYHSLENIFLGNSEMARHMRAFDWSKSDLGLGPPTTWPQTLRAEQLAELDRAKTTFFSNVSHEFRTPLTLMLGPLENAITNLSDPQKQKSVASNLEIVHRNGLRLLKLVNTLLDFSRIEAGRVQASFEPTDLSAITIECASVFRSAMERAGLKYTVECSPIPEAVYIDKEMWEKIVLDLLSNAFKFTFEGEITVILKTTDEGVELIVKDTGIGIADAELPRLFERFHRIENAKSRTHEGSGIGLALV